MSEMLRLRPYQEASLDKLRAGFASGHRAQVLYLATGGGKSELAIELLVATMEKGNRAAFVADRRVLVEQMSARLDKYGVDHGVMQAGHWRFRPHLPIQVCSAQTLEKRGNFPGLSLVIVDEAHVTRQQTVRFIQNNTGIKAIGLTATPFTKGLGKTYTHVATAVTTQELVNDGYLVPLRYFVAKEIDMTGAKVVAGEWSEKDASERGIKITGDVVAEWIKKTHEIYGGPRKTIVFCAGVAHGQDLSEKFNAAGYNFLSISYRDDDEFKREAFKEFAKPDSSIHGLIATDILTRGFDVPDTDICVMARPFTKSFSSYVQQIGRVMRPFAGKEFGVVIDHAGNVLRFREDWERIYGDGVDALDDGLEKPRKEPTVKEKEAAKCPKCSHLWPGNADVCPCCGHVRERRNEVMQVAGEVIELHGGDRAKASKEDKQQWYSGLLGYAESHGYKNGWAYHKYHEKWGVYPGGLRQVAQAPAPEVMSWIKSRNIAFAKRRAA